MSAPTPSTEGLKERLEAFLDERNFGYLMAALAVLTIVVVLVIRFDNNIELPGKPPPPPPPDKDALRRMDFENPDVYRTYVEEDVVRYAVTRVTPDDLAQPFPYEKSEVPQRLTVGGPALETGMLRISLDKQTLVVKRGKGTANAAHVVMRIENKRPVPVAYRVETRTGVGEETCAVKAALDHNAFAIAGRSAVQRTECLLVDGLDVTVMAVETMELPELSYHYVSRLVPTHLGVSPRTSAGHQAPSGGPCATIPQQMILIGMEKGTVSWRDVVDFYARHRCETYDFVLGYRAFTKQGQYKLPVSSRTLAPPR